jgi:hypothetical protein
MIIIGCDFHSRFQQIALLDTETGKVEERRLEHENGEARAFYAGLREPALVGIESMGYTQWFEELLAEFGPELVVATRRRFGRWKCASRNTIAGMRSTC